MCIAMKKLLQRVLGFALVSLLSAINVALGAPKDAPIVIAHVAPTTGRFALHAEADRRGAEMAIEEFNSRGGVLGREIVLVSRDPTLDASRAARVAEELITQTKVGFLVGAIHSGVAASMSAVCQRYGVIFINTNSSAPSESVENAHRTKFVFDASAANFNRALLKYAFANRKSKRVLLLTEDDAWGHSSADASRPYIAEYGGTVVGEVVVPEALPDPAGVLKRVAAIPADVVAVNISGDNQIKLFSRSTRRRSKNNRGSWARWIGKNFIPRREPRGPCSAPPGRGISIRREPLNSWPATGNAMAIPGWTFPVT